MVDGEIRAGAIPPWCTATQQSVKLEPVDFSTERIQRTIRRATGKIEG